MRTSRHAIRRGVQRGIDIPIEDIVKKGVALMLSSTACVYKYMYRDYVAIVNSGVIVTVYKNGQEDK